MNRLPSLVRQHIAAFRGLLFFTVLTGILYPLVMFGVAQVAFHNQANGSLLTKNGQVIGSSLIGQWFDPANANYFHPRPSATVDANTGKALPYAANNSAGSNLGPSNQALIDRIKQQIQDITNTTKNIVDGVPVDMVTTSFSGLDPDISVANARLQADSVAAARGLDPAKVQALVDKYTQGRMLWVFGEPHVNVLLINLALDNGEAG